jgi:hypothetical protein
MENKNVRLKGRPVMAIGKRVRKIDVRFTQEEYEKIIALEKQLGISKTELVRMRVLKDSGLLVVNARDLMKRLDVLGAELSRVGNNINQLARYANILNKRGLLSPQIIERSNQVMSDYVCGQQQLEIIIRKIIRSMGK